MKRMMLLLAPGNSFGGHYRFRCDHDAEVHHRLG